MQAGVDKLSYLITSQIVVSMRGVALLCSYFNKCSVCIYIYISIVYKIVHVMTWTRESITLTIDCAQLITCIVLTDYEYLGSFLYITTHSLYFMM